MSKVKCVKLNFTNMLMFYNLYINLFVIYHFHLDSPNFHTNSPHFHPDSHFARQCRADFPHSHFIPCVPLISFPKISILVFADSLLKLKSLRIYFKKVVTLVQKRIFLFLTAVLLSSPRHQIIVCIIYDVISNITKNYLLYSASSKKSIIREV